MLIRGFGSPPYYGEKDGPVTAPGVTAPVPEDYWEVGYEHQDMMTLTLLERSLKVMPSDLLSREERGHSP